MSGKMSEHRHIRGVEEGFVRPIWK